MKFPIFKTRINSLKRSFNLIDPGEAKVYFEAKAGSEIKKLREYLKTNTFVAYLLGKKNSGKGTYSKIFAEIVNPKKVEHFSIGDMVRTVDEELKNKKKKKELFSFLEKNYRGWHSLEQLKLAMEKRSTKTLLPSELILTLVKREIARREKKALFIDGFPRDMDQISYSLFFRDLIGYREDPDIFVLINVPESVIDQRIKWRRICPRCQAPNNLKLMPTKKVGFDKKKKEPYLICNNPRCREARMIEKEGDELGIKTIKERLKLDEKIIEQSFSLFGIPKILLRNSVPVKRAGEFIDDYEITPEYIFEWNEKTKKVKTKEKPWLILDDEGIQSYSLLPPPVAVSLIKQMAEVLNL